MRSSPAVKFRYALLGAAAAGLVLVTTTALAGSGIGGVFNLGQTNTVDAQTVLKGNPGGSPQLKVTSLGSATAVRGEASIGIGVNGASDSGTGLQGLSQTGIGMFGTHGANTGASPGVRGETNSTDPSGAGVVGKNNGGGPGLKALVNPGAPPLAVNSGTKVANLNADSLDGNDSSDFLPSSALRTGSGTVFGPGPPPDGFAGGYIDIVGPFRFHIHCVGHPYTNTSFVRIGISSTVDHSAYFASPGTGAEFRVAATDMTAGVEYPLADSSDIGSPTSVFYAVTGSAAVPVDADGPRISFQVYVAQNALGVGSDACTGGASFIMF